MESLSNPNKESFDQAQRKVQGLLESDAYLRFLQSELYKDLLPPKEPSPLSPLPLDPESSYQETFELHIQQELHLHQELHPHQELQPHQELHQEQKFHPQELDSHQLVTSSIKKPEFLIETQNSLTELQDDLGDLN